MNLNKAEKRKLQRLIDSIFEECPSITSIEKFAGLIKINGDGIPQRIRANGANGINDAMKGWLIEHSLSERDVLFFMERENLYFSGQGFLEFSFIRKK